MFNLDYIITIATKYPEVAAMVGGTALSWAPGLTLETWVLPEDWPDRKIKQVTLGVTVAVAAVMTAVLWKILDPTPDGGVVVAFLSLGSALSAPVVHKVAAAVLTHFFPYLDSVFKFKPRISDVSKPPA
jgi:hypothetical protein